MRISRRTGFHASFCGLPKSFPRRGTPRISRCGRIPPRSVPRAGLSCRLPRRGTPQNPRSTAMRILCRASARASNELALQKAVLSRGTETRRPRFMRGLRSKNRAGKRGARTRGQIAIVPAYTAGGCPEVHGRSRALAHVLALEDCDHSCSYHHIDICCGPYYY